MFSRYKIIYEPTTWMLPVYCNMSSILPWGSTTSMPHIGVQWGVMLVKQILLVVRRSWREETSQEPNKILPNICIYIYISPKYPGLFSFFRPTMVNQKNISPRPPQAAPAKAPGRPSIGSIQRTGPKDI